MDIDKEFSFICNICKQNFQTDKIHCVDCNVNFCLKCSFLHDDKYPTNHKCIYNDLGNRPLFSLPPGLTEEEKEIEYKKIRYDDRQLEKFLRDSLGYQFCMNMNCQKPFPKFDSVKLFNAKDNWKARDDLYLFQNMIKMDFNWEDIAQVMSKRLKKNLTANDVKEYYKERYIYGYIGRLVLAWVHTNLTNIQLSTYPIYDDNIKETFVPKKSNEFNVNFNDDKDFVSEKLISVLNYKHYHEDIIEEKMKAYQFDIYIQHLNNRFRNKIILEQNDSTQFLNLDEYDKDEVEEILENYLDKYKEFIPFYLSLPKDEFNEFIKNLLAEQLIKFAIKRIIEFKLSIIRKNFKPKSINIPAIYKEKLSKNKNIQKYEQLAIQTYLEIKMVLEDECISSKMFKELMKWVKKLINDILLEINSDFKIFSELIDDNESEGTELLSDQEGTPPKKQVILERMDSFDLNENEIELCNSLTISSTLYLKFKKILLKYEKKQTKNPHQIVEFDKILRKYSIDNSQMDNFKKVYQHLHSKGYLKLRIQFNS